MPSGIVLAALVGVPSSISAMLSEVMRRVCLRWGVLDQPKDNRWHRLPRPRLGGLAIFAALAISTGVAAGYPLPRPAAGLIVGAAFACAWGLADDLWRLLPRMRLLLLAANGAIALAFGLRLDAPHPLLGTVLTVVWVMGITNGVNLIDNMDGVAGGVAASAAAVLFGMAVASGNFLGAKIALSLGGAALGFLVLNFPPARIFMGDCGSGVVGYALAVTALLVVRTSAAPFPVPLFAAALVLGVPILDTTLVVIQRLLRRRPIMVGGRDHLAHHLVARGLSERGVCGLLWAVTLMAGAAAMLAMDASRVARIVALGLVPLLAVGALGVLVPPADRRPPLQLILGRFRARYGALIAEGALIAAGLALLYAPVLATLSYAWRTDEEYSHGPLVLLLSAYLVWARRRELARCPRAPSVIGYPIILLGLSLLLVGQAAIVGYFMNISLLVVGAGIVLFCVGLRTLRALAFPLLYLLFAIPVPYVAFDRVTLPLQHLASASAASVLDVIGVPVLLQGNVITLPAVQLGVVEACSGIRSLMSLGAIGTIYAYFAVHGWWRRAVVVTMAIPIAIVANVLRIALTGILTEFFGVRAAMGFYHTFSGLVLFALAVGMLIAAGHAISTITGARNRGDAYGAPA